MKFLSALVVLTLAVAANGSIVGWGAWPWGAPAWSPYAGTNIISNGPIWAGAPAAVVATHGPAAVIAAHGPAVIPSASYFGANRGSVHVAPLPGHVQSVSSINVQPAPGTW